MRQKRSKEPKQELSKEVKRDNYCYRKDRRAKTAYLKSNRENFNIAIAILLKLLPIFGVPIIYYYL